MNCPNCGQNKPQYDPLLGILPCQKCQGKQINFRRPKSAIEFTTDDIKQQRKEFADDIIQPHRKGRLSKEWLDKYGRKSALNHGFSEKEIREARNVWNGDTTYYKEN
jgi:hypothetical protein